MQRLEELICNHIDGLLRGFVVLASVLFLLSFAAGFIAGRLT